MSLLDIVLNSDLIAKFKPGIQEGKYILNREDDKIWSMGDFQGNTSDRIGGPWVYVNNPPDGLCQWHQDICKYLEFIPTHCMHCWKIFVRLPNLQCLMEMMKAMYDMVAEDPEVYCKCGSEIRTYIRGNWGGYFYTRSLETAFERYDQVRKIVSERINPAIKVGIKRGCTEMEHKHGPSVDYKQPPITQMWEQQIKFKCHMPWAKVVQSEQNKMAVMADWLRFGWDRDDPTLPIFTGGRLLTPDCFTYHDKQLKDIEHMFKYGDN